MQTPCFNKRGTFANDIDVKWNELFTYYTKDKVRKNLLQRGKPALIALKTFGITSILIGGSFASKKAKPNDIDGVFELPKEIKEQLSEAVLILLEECGLDLYPADMPTSLTGQSHLDFFKIGHFNERPGLIKLNLEDIE